MSVTLGVLSVFMCRQGIEDWKTRHMLLSELVFGFALCVLTWLFMPWEVVLVRAVFAAGVFIVFFLLSKATRGEVGEGDGMVMAIMVGMAGAVIAIEALLLALFISAATAMVMMLLLKKDRKSSLPFVAFLFIALEVRLCLSAVQ